MCSIKGGKILHHHMSTEGQIKNLTSVLGFLPTWWNTGKLWLTIVYIIYYIYFITIYSYNFYFTKF